MAMRKVGVEVHHSNPMTMWHLRLPRLLADRGIETILDVGANDGGYAADVLAGGYTGRIISFEPLPAARTRLEAKASGYDGRWTLGPRIALSNRDGEAEFHEAGNSVSSSLLPMTKAHTDAAPASETVQTITVETRRLDDILPSLGLVPPAFLKLDVQGAESLVLEGAIQALQGAIVGVQLEMSLAPLYEDQASAADLDALLRAQGFECWDILPGFRDPNTLRLLQYDGIYWRAGPRR